MNSSSNWSKSRLPSRSAPILSGGASKSCTGCRRTSGATPAAAFAVVWNRVVFFRIDIGYLWVALQSEFAPESDAYVFILSYLKRYYLYSIRLVCNECDCHGGLFMVRRIRFRRSVAQWLEHRSPNPRRPVRSSFVLFCPVLFCLLNFGLAST